MNIVFGGTFNPPTKAHYLIINYLLNKYNPENLIIVPVSNKYPKEKISDEKRLEMLEILFKNKDRRIIISDIEIKNKIVGTYYTLKELNKEYQDIYFIMGADNFSYLDKWIESKKLLNEFKFIIISRDNIDIKELIKSKFKDYQNNIIIDNNLNFDISSTKIRENKLFTKEYLNEEIIDYIKKNNLYKEE